MKTLALVLLLLLVLQVQPHTYKCIFDQANLDLTHNPHHTKPPVPLHHPDNTHGRMLLSPSRGPLRIHLDTNSFGTVAAAASGTANTTMTKLNFILKAMMVTQQYLQGRIKVSQLATVYSPSYCVDFAPPSTDQTSGFSDTDLVIYVKYLTDASISYGATGKSCNYYPGNATATPDVLLQVGRPTAGRIIFNTYVLVDQEATLTNRLFQSITSTALHETIHIIGFDSTLYPYFLNSNTGSPYTSPQVKSTSTYNPVNSNRPKTDLLSTPAVLAWAKNFFDCSTLLGMPLENQDLGNGSSGSHWERVAMYDQLMTASSFGATKGISGLTMALLQDSGWYTVDSTFVQTSNYGYKKGCSFVLDACYNSTNFNTFCDSVALNNVSSCQSTFYGKALCEKSNNSMTDMCGIFVPVSNCVDESSVDKGYQVNTHEVFGTNSFCVSSTLSTVTLASTQQSRCYPYVCGTSSIVFTIGTATVTCLSSQAGVKKTATSLTGDLTCPIFTQFCTVSRKTCKNWCSQQGYCTDGVCNCLAGYSGEDCSKSICSSITYYNPSTGLCVSSCPTGTYQNIYSRTCLSCKSPCSQCINSPTNCINCVSTLNSIQYFYNNTCISTCPSDTFTSGYTCVACDSVGAHCASCTSSAVLCTSCNSGLYLSQPTAGSCIATCAGTSYPLLVVDYSICVSSCPSNMYAPGNGTCLLCPVGSYLYQGSCGPTCLSQYYQDNTLRACMLCHSSCSSCDGPYPQNCTSCVTTSGSPYLLQKMCFAICPKGYYANTPAGNCTPCTASLNCTACTYNATTTVIKCTICQYGTYFQPANSTCLTSCPAGQFKNKWNSSCSSCNSACDQCTGPTKNSCTSCLTPARLLINSTGGYCMNPCPSVGYVPFGTTCQPCDSTCLSCNGVSANQCSNCQTGYYLYGGYCRYVCPNGTYPNSTTLTCLNCDATCSYCFGGTSSNCSTCAAGLYLFNFSCTSSCPVGMTPNSWNVCYEGYLYYVVLLMLTILT